MRSVCLAVMAILLVGATPRGVTAQTPGPARVRLSQAPDRPHVFEVDVESDTPLELVGVRVMEGPRVWGRFTMLCETPSRGLSFQTAPFRFLPALYTVEVEVDDGRQVQQRAFGPYANAVEKLIVVDRDGYPQRVSLIEGDRYFLFGRLVSSAEVSSGLRKYGGTPLGYYNVRNKEYFAINPHQEWDMPFAHWYTPETYPEGVNGLHEGFEGTLYGIPQSHGCTRMPPWFARTIWAWSLPETPLIYMGNEYLTAYDRGRFRTEDYRLFKTLLHDVLAYHQGLESGQEAATCFSPREAELVDAMRPFQDDLLDTCANFRLYATGGGFYSIVRRFADLRGLD
jgi:lipoprotein-anchoring transpeptidase ErfK/SrfK